MKSINHKLKTIFLMTLFLSIHAQQDSRYHEQSYVGSSYLGEKTIRVYLPPSYSKNNDNQYPVLYMMDGQNLFFDSLAYFGHSWRISDISDQLVKGKYVKEFIIVGIDHAGINRFAEYMPEKPLKSFSNNINNQLKYQTKPNIYSDTFLMFFVNELIPFIQNKYRTLFGPNNTFVGGSSMGALISMYALCEYPEVFGGAICMSTHWPVSLDNTTIEVSDELLAYFSKHIPSGKLWYFDHGTLGLDKDYEPYQLKADEILNTNGYTRGKNWITRKFKDHDHNEEAWSSRLEIPLQFIFGT